MGDERAINPNDIVTHFSDEVTYVGDGAIKYADVILSRRNHKHKIASPAQQFICASAVGILGLEKYHRNELLDVVSCVPVYLRSADALVKKAGGFLGRFNACRISFSGILFNSG